MSATVALVPPVPASDRLPYAPSGNASLRVLHQFLPGDRPELATDPSAWSEADEGIATAHYERLREATETGRVILAGRSQDGIGPAIVIFRAKSEHDARRFMEEDPFVASGLFRASLHPFRAALVEQRTEG